VVVLVGVVLAAPALGLGIGADDHFQRARLKGVPLPGLGRTHDVYLELFDFLPTTDRGRAEARAIGLLPWWVHPEARFKFPRPLTVATHVLDYRLWPDVFALQHAHSLLWYAAAILVAALLLRRLCGAAEVAALAALLFAVSDTHVQPAAWLCNRNALICFVLGGLAILAHVRWRRRGGLAWLAAALVAAAAALLGGEAAIGAFAYIAAHELFLERGAVARRLLALLPYALLAVGWQLGYRALGFGAAGLGWYQDPAVDLPGYLAAVGERLPALLLAQWARVSADLLYFVSRPWQLAWVAGGLVVMGGLGLVFWRQLREDARARFWAGGMLLSLLPVCAAFPMDRALLFPGLGAFALLAGQAARLGWLQQAAPPWPAGPETGARGAGEPAPPPPSPGRARRGACVAVGALLVLHAGLAPLAFLARLVGWGLMQRASERAERAIPSEPSVAGQSVLWVNGSDFGNLGVLAARHVRGAPAPRASHVLSSFVTAATISRPDAWTLVVLPDGGFLARPADRLLRGSRPPFHREQRVATLDYTASVEEVTSDGRPRRVAYRFRAPLEDPSYRWLCFGDGYDPRPFRLPRVGESVRLSAPRL